MCDNLDSSDINILIVGETGVGKSTFINAFANYIKFGSFDEAAESTDIISLIPSNFMMMDKNYKERKVKFGDDPNECNQPGASSTMEPRVYKIPFKGRSLTLIDTPGIGDTNGIKKDEENMEDIMATIAEFKHLHGILILLHPNDSRVSVLFKYCIKELLSSLEKSAAQNIIFVFTNSRGNLFRPGATCTPLRAVLKEIQDKPPKVKIPFTESNWFCMENDVFQFLIAKKDHMFSENEIKAYKESWNKSSSETFKMLKFMKSLKPHNLQGTVSVNNSRTLIIRLCKPLADITQNINDNVSQLKKQRTLRENTSLSLKELQKKLVVKRIGLKINKIDKPKTVCGHQDCVEYSKVDGASTVTYPQICHVKCKRKGVEKNVIGDARLINCWAFKTKSGLCRNSACGHSYLYHLHIYYETEPFDYEAKDEEVIKEICTNEEVQDVIDRKMEKIQSVIKDYEHEQGVIQGVMANFSHFLKHNAITPINDAYKDYIMYFIDLERKKVGSDRTKIEYYQKLIAQYEKRVESLEQNWKDANENAPTRTNLVVSSLHVQKLKNELFSLPMYGQTIRDALNAQREARFNNQIQITEHNNLKPQDINILLLGQMGVGKSTFVNSLANYIKFGSFDEAAESEDIISMIPSNFIIVDDNFKVTNIKFGEDPNECNIPDVSSTRKPRIYKVPYKDRSVILIDTPGVGSMSEIKEDEENIQGIMATIAAFKHLHAIVILLHPNNSRGSVHFKNCIQGFLSNLEKTAAQNIVFVFTNSRGTSFRPGNTMVALRSVLEEIQDKPPNIEIPFNGTNTFCVDNEAFRFLIAKKNQIEFMNDDIKAFEESWNRSVNVIFEMLQYIEGLKPYNVQGTLSVNTSRTFITRFTKPLAEVTQNVLDNLNRFEKQQKLRDNKELSLMELRQKLNVKRIGLKIIEKPMPSTVCVDKNCVKYVTVDGVSTITFPKPCHELCKDRNIKRDSLGEPGLQNCSAFKRNFMPGRTCRHCGHNYLAHLHIYHQSELYEYDEKDEGVDKEITTEEDEQNEIQRLMDEIASNIRAYKSELMVILRVMAKFTHFLKYNAITPVGDAYKDYILFCIKLEESEESDHTKIKFYEDLVAKYDEYANKLELDLKEANKRAPTMTNSVVSSADIEKLKNELFSLPLNGQTIRNVLKAQQDASYNSKIESISTTVGDNRNQSDINILLLGETGVGKSTFVNNFVSFIKSLDEAAEIEDIISATPSNLITDDNFKETQVKFADDLNECSKPGASSTIEPQMYKVLYQGSSVNLIDTPGFGDTPDVKKDEENMQNLLATMAEIKHLHAILILVHPNKSGEDLRFKYCIKQLLSSFSKNAASNIVFVFTNSTETLYETETFYETAQRTKAVLEELKHKFPNVKIPFNESNTGCVDNALLSTQNALFSSLTEKKNQIKSLDGQTREFGESLKRSANEIFRLVEYITDLKPFNMEDTLSVNTLRKLIIRLNNPPTEILQTIPAYINKLERYTKKEDQYPNPTHQYEHDVIEETMLKFVLFIKNNAIIPYNDTYKDYIITFIHKEKLLDNNADPEKIRYFEQLIAEYEKMVNLFEQKLPEKNDQTMGRLPVSSADIEVVMNRLCSLPMIGASIKEVLDGENTARNNNKIKIKEFTPLQTPSTNPFQRYRRQFPKKYNFRS